MPLTKLSIRDAEYLTDYASGEGVYHVYDPHALVQAAGYLKFKNGAEKDEGVFFRGETKLHGSLSPTLFRGLASQAGQSRRIHQLNYAIAQLKEGNKIFNSFPTESHEAILQHYGLKTSWLDLVDNIWVALWFACHRAHSTGPAGEYLHFERRTNHKEPDGFVYILLVAADQGPNSRKSPGRYLGPDTELIDLRAAAPSIFLRPHAQHGLVFRARGDRTMRPLDYKSQVRGTIRIALADALSWLGDGRMLGVHALFPPPYYDRGYSILLRAGFPASKQLGAIAHVGA
jgi:hypothetical protein